MSDDYNFGTIAIIASTISIMGMVTDAINRTYFKPKANLFKNNLILDANALSDGTYTQSNIGLLFNAIRKEELVNYKNQEKPKKSNDAYKPRNLAVLVNEQKRFLYKLEKTKNFETKKIYNSKKHTYKARNKLV